MLNLPEQGYTPANYQALVELTQLSNAQFCLAFDIPEQTFYKHRSGTRTMKWRDWQALATEVIKYIKEINMHVLAEGTIYQLREQFGLDSSAGIEQVEQAVMDSRGHRVDFQFSTTCKNNYYKIFIE